MSILAKLASNSWAAIDNGIYEVDADLSQSGADLPRVIRANRHAALVAEVKFASPSLGRIRTTSNPATVASEMIAGGASALSVLTQPYLFGGSPRHFMQVRQVVDVPMLMKDIIVDTVQMDAAGRMGADYILLIQSMFEHGHLQDVDRYVEEAHSRELGVLLEVHTAGEMRRALETRADLIGINNRNLDTLEVDMGTTERILADFDPDRPVLSESGVKTPDDIRYLRRCGADAFLVGSSIMKSDNIRRQVTELVNAY